ncbi:MAG TPA: sugar phosphate nucleotidyltransferase [Streptosporangiaceae bacterium]|nr:sugar phosphate nucleotidyltransferase [Streptosporangiaceae bacterium]
MTGGGAIQVVVCAGGLGTRIADWSRYIPKEFYPVGGRPGITHLLDEITRSGPADVVIVCHPYYDAFTAWARTALSKDSQDRYARAARLRPGPGRAGEVTVSFITQHGPYADLTSVLNGADHLAAGDLYVAFADNLYPGDSPLHALSRAPAGHPAVLGRTYQRELAASHGVIAAVRHDGELHVRELIEKPGLAAAIELEQRYGAAQLRLLEGRARLTAGFVSYARGYRAPPGTEPKLALALAAYARHCPVSIITTASQVIDLGAGPACGCTAAQGIATQADSSPFLGGRNGATTRE